jgi:hypothetical protein
MNQKFIPKYVKEKVWNKDLIFYKLIDGSAGNPVRCEDHPRQQVYNLHQKGGKSYTFVCDYCLDYLSDIEAQTMRSLH